MARLPRYRSALATSVAAFYRASPGLTVLTLLTATVFGLLQPAFVVATGVLVQAAATGADILAPLTFLGSVFIATRVLGPIRDELGVVLWRRVDQGTGDRIMRSVSAQPGLEQVEDPRVQDLVTQMEGAVTGFSVGQAAQQLPFMWSQRVFAVCALLIVFRTYWWAALVLAVAYALGYSGARWHWQEVTEILLNRTDQLRRSFYVRNIALSSRMAKETRVFGLTRWLVDRYRHSATTVMRASWDKRKEGWLIGIGLAMLVSAAEASTIWMVANDSLSGRVSIGNAVALIQAVFAAGFLSLYNDPDYSLSLAATTVDKIDDLERTVQSVSTRRTGSRDPDGLPRRAIRFEGVSFTYPGSSRAIFDDFHLEVEAGTSLAIVGENGAGKTTLVKLLARLYEPISGRITVDDVDLRELEPAAWHRRVAAVFQDFTQFELSAYDNVAFGAIHTNPALPELERAAQHAGALEIIQRLPDAWTTPLSRQLSHGSQLSGGEWQRLALARALFAVQSGAGILILDEPTASLDVRGEAEIYQRFLELTRGVTTIVISHRFSTVRRADRIVVVEHGHVVESGSHAELMQLNEGRYAAMYTLQAARFTPA